MSDQTSVQPQTPAQAAAPQAAAPAQQSPNGTVVQSQQVGKYTVRVINDKCIGAASCIAIAPKLYELNEQNIAVVISQDDTDDNKLLSAQSCPTSAIEVVDNSTGEIVWPK